MWILPLSTATINETAAPSGILEIVNIEVYVEGNAHWNWGLYADGSQTPNLSGLYDLYVRGSVFMGATFADVAVYRGVFILFDQVGLFGGGQPPYPPYGLWVGGNSIDVTFNATVTFRTLWSPDRPLCGSMEPCVVEFARRLKRSPSTILVCLAPLPCGASFGGRQSPFKRLIGIPVA